VIEPLLCPVVGAVWLAFMLITTPVHGLAGGATVSFLQLKIIHVANKNIADNKDIFFIFFI
jgi:hypothetical protein